MVQERVYERMSAFKPCVRARERPQAGHVRLEAVMDLEDRVFHPILDECLPQAVSV